ncbi:MAG: reverse transcriptase domain-containing protein [Candidatus Uhrbacteria bacterium]
MFDKIISLENLFSAWQEFRCGKRNRSDVQEFERNLEDNIFALHDDLKNGNYHHSEYHRFHIFDPKHRIIHKATVRDRLVHHAVYRVLLPVFEQGFVFDSYSCRVGKGTHAAVRRLEKFVRRVSKNYSSSCFGLKFDIKKFFTSVDHEILLKILQRKIVDSKTIGLLSEIVGSFRSEMVSALRPGSEPENFREASNSRGGGVRRKCQTVWIADRKFNLTIVCQCLLGRI